MGRAPVSSEGNIGTGSGNFNGCFDGLRELSPIDDLLFIPATFPVSEDYRLEMLDKPSALG